MAVTPEQLERYIAGNCSPEEKQAVEQWIRDSTADFGPARVEEKKVLSEVWQRLSLESVQRKKKRSWIPALIFKVAAVLLIAFTVTIGIFYKQEQSAAASRYFVTKRGERKQLTLPDGSQVFLNSESSLKYSREFGDTSREMTLTGEAFFKVAPDAAKPFVIHTAKSTTRVLGTEFDLKCYPGDEISISVKEGKVAFFAKDNAAGAVVLNGGEAAHLKEGQNPVKQTLFSPQAVAWIENKLIIDNEKLARIAARLERWYNIKIHISSPLIAEIRCSGTFADQPAEKVIKSLCFSAGLHYKLSNNVFLIY